MPTPWSETHVWFGPGYRLPRHSRGLLFGYHTVPFLRPQRNVAVTLRPNVQADVSPLLRYRLGLDATLNMPIEDIFR